MIVIVFSNLLKSQYSAPYKHLLTIEVGVAVGAVHQVLLGEVVLHVSGGGPHAGVDGGDGG